MRLATIVVVSLLSSAGTAQCIPAPGVSVPISQDSITGPLAIGFAFPFNGNTYTDIHLSDHGICFLSNAGVPAPPLATPLVFNPTGASLVANGPVICPIWSDSIPGLSGMFFIDPQPTVCTVTWVDVQSFGFPSPLFTFQMILHGNGSIEFVYGPNVTNNSTFSSTADNGVVGVSPGTPAALPAPSDMSASPNSGGDPTLFEEFPVANSFDMANGRLLLAPNVSSGWTASYTPNGSGCPQVAPASPSNLVAMATSPQTIQLSWIDNSNNEAGFTIERSPDGVMFSQLTTVNGNVTSHLDTGLTPNATYHYRVFAHNAVGNSGVSNVASATTPQALPTAPSSLVAQATSPSTIQLSWIDNSNNEAGFAIERSLNGVSFSPLTSVGAGTTSYLDSGLAAGTTYHYRVRAFNTAGNSGWSNVASATTPTPPMPPAAPSGLSASATTPDTIALSWTDNSNNEDGFTIERSLNGTSFSTLASVGSDVTSHVDAGLSAHTQYHYRVFAFNAAGSSGTSNVASATTPGLGSFVTEQNPVFNSPVVCDALGLGSGCDRPEQSQDMCTTIDMGSAGILLHSGQELRDETDLVIAGRDDATTFRIMRRHLTRVDQSDSPFGPAWAFNYRHVFSAMPNGDLEMTSFGRKDTFRLVGTGVWEGGAGRLDRLVVSGGVGTLRRPDGTKLVFATEGAAATIVGHLTAVVSPNANMISLIYETAAQQPDLLKRKILTMTESYGRVLDFFYQDPDFADGVSKIRDFTGREVVYDYNTAGQLLTVRSPTVTSTGGLNDFPGGKTRAYAYLNHADPSLTHALTSVVFPNQQPQNGKPRLSWTYDTTATSPSFGFVLTHTIGNPGASGGLAAGGTFSYAYEYVPPAGPVGPDTAVIRTAVTDRRGTVATLELNSSGQVLEEAIASQGLRPGPQPTFTRRFTYNADGDLVQVVEPLGTTSNRTHVSPGHPRNSHANEIVDERPVDSRGGDQALIRTEVIYEPVFNKPFQEIDPRGFTTTYVFDYMEDLPAATAHFAPDLGLTPAQLQAFFNAAGIVDQAGDVNGDGRVDQFCGNVISTRHPAVQRPAEAALLGLAATETAEEFFVFNVFGQLVEHRDEEENVTLFEYFGADDPDGDGVVNVVGANPNTGGYIRRVTADATAGPGRQSGQDPTPVIQVTEYEYTSQSGGTLPANERGVATAMVDPRGIKHLYLVNELDQVVKTVRSADVSASPEPGLSTFSYEHITLYDANDNVVETRMQNKDTLPPANDFVVTRYTFDILDQMTSERTDQGFEDILDTYAYDPSQNLVQRVRGASSPAQSVERWLYDERDLLVSHTRGFGSPEVSTVTTRIDLNGNIVQVVDATGGDVFTTDYDGFDRVRSTVDRVGNRAKITYDGASNVLSVGKFGPGDHAAAVGDLLARTDTHYDERDRAFREDRYLFHYAGQSVGALNGGALYPGDQLVTTVTIHDRMSRVVGVVDPDADLFETRYDGLSRVVRTLDPAGNEVVLTYDPNHNLRSVEDIEAAPGLIPAPQSYTTSYSYDSLDRRIAVVEPNNQRTTFAYDSRDNVIRTTDELGNQTDTTYDRIDRVRRVETFLSTTGTNASSANKDPSQGGGDGVVTVEQAWDDLHRVVSRTDDRGNVTRYFYDDLDRKVRCDYGDGTFELWQFNADGELVKQQDQNGSYAVWTNDPKGRPVEVRVDNSAAAANVLGSTRRTWAYDGLDRVVSSTDDNGAAPDVACAWIYDSLSLE